MKVRIIKTLSELESLAGGQFQVPIDLARMPTQDYIWHLSCAEVLANQGQLAVVAIENGPRLAALAPMQGKSDFANVYDLLGARLLGEPSDFSYKDESSLNALTEALSKWKNPIRLSRVRADSQSIISIRRAFRNKGIVIINKSSDYPYIELDLNVKDPEQSLSSHLRSDLRRAQHKADSMGTVQFEMHTPVSEQEFFPLYEQVIQVEAAGWKGREGTSLLNDPLEQDFFRRYGIRAAKQGILRIAFLRIGSEYAATQFAVQSGGSFWLLKIGYDEKFTKCSPGNLLTLYTLRYAASQGLRFYEFLGSSELWTKHWTTQERATVQITAYPYSIIGVLSLMNKIACWVYLKASNIIRSRQ